MRLFAVLLFFSNYCLWAQIEFVQIDTLSWSITNLSVTTFRNGDPIRNARTREEWIQCLSDGIPAYCDYKNDSTFGNRFGHLYNWFAIADPRGLAPIGARVSNNRDWSSLYRYINKDVFNWESKGLLCERLRSIEGWNCPKKGENWYDFNLLAGGYRNENGEFFGLGAETSIWVRDTLSYGVVSRGNAMKSPYALFHGLKPDVIFTNETKKTGCYVRLVYGKEEGLESKKQPQSDADFLNNYNPYEAESNTNQTDKKRKSKSKN